MFVIDVNTSFGKRVDDDPRYSLGELSRLLEAHRVAGALAFSRQGVDYDPRAGNAQSIEAGRAGAGILPAATLDMRAWLGWEEEIRRCLAEGVRAFRFFPGLQGWTAGSASFRRVLERLRGTGSCLLFSVAEPAPAWDLPGQVARATEGFGLPVVLLDCHYALMAELIAVMRDHRHVHAETNAMATVGAVEILAGEVGAERVLYGSNAPVRPMQKALNEVLEAGIPDGDKEAILGGNAMRLLGLDPGRFAGRPGLEDLEPKRFGEEVIDVHSHLGYWRYPIRDEGYDPAGMIGRMRRYGVTHGVLSSYESMRYNIASGNRAVAGAIEGHPQLHGYVELNPHQLDLSVAEMDRYYGRPGFVGSEVELSHIPCPTMSAKVRALMAAAARRGKPVLLLPGEGGAAAERDLARTVPDLTIIHAHGFDADWARAVADTPNICVEFNFSRPSHHDVRDALDILGPRRVLFGSDQTFLSLGASIGLYLDAGMDAGERGPVLHGNARRIFGL